ncbi:MAG: glycine--tRNA ligase subunit beta [Luteitalea sp.]|nr:glycine--tRNA ligase subunit beta [Luteitalea sp.]
MDRELLLEIGVEELPAAWLTPLTEQLADRLSAELSAFRLAPGAPVETFATPRRLTATVAKLAERQAEHDETVTGPSVDAAYGADRQPTAAALGFARKHHVEVGELERLETPRGTYLAVRKRERGRAAVDVLPNVLAAILCGLSFPKHMRWDASLEDPASAQAATGKGRDLPFGRPIRWLLFLYGGRVVPFVIRRTPLAQTTSVQDVRSGAVTYGHRFLALSGRPGRTVKVRSFADYRTRLGEHFVLLSHQERYQRLMRELDTHARRLGGRVSASAQGALVDEVADLVEYPCVVAGVFPPDFLDLPEEVLTTTMIHHQHYFPVADERNKLMPAFLAVTNIESDQAQRIAINAERVLSARLRDARFFWDADRRTPLEAKLARLDTLLFHKRLGSYRDKAERLERLAGWLAGDVLGHPDARVDAATAGRLAKADLTTDMVRELTELQGTMGGIYAREEGQPEAVWRAIAYHYLPVGVEANLPPTREQLGSAAVTWAAVAVADKVDSLVAMFGAGETPTGTRDPFGLRRHAQGLLKLLVDLPEVAQIDRSVRIDTLVDHARRVLADSLGASWATGAAAPETALATFLIERLRYLFERRGYRYDAINAVLPADGRLDGLSPLAVRRRLEALRALGGSDDFEALAVLFKRVKNIARELPPESLAAARAGEARLREQLREPAELALLDALEARTTSIEAAIAREDFTSALTEAAAFRPAVDRFFNDVFVMVDDPALRAARLRLVADLRDLVLGIADISEIVSSGQ